ncbi:MAG: ABC transporter ATP-binding protein [Bacteroidetes bacterium]|nr:ABC transporter ATP-binding protein [Bacteroidota bacterium]
MITIQDLHYSYRRKPVLDGLNLNLQPGYIYGLLGKNGAGKSTLLKNMAGLLFPRQGQIHFGKYIPGRRDPGFLQQIFLVPEEFHVPPIRIGEWVRYQSPFYPRWSTEMFNRTLKEFEIPEDMRLSELSFGQQKKAYISFALSTGASTLLMDEPTNGLDITSKSQFRKVIAGSLDEQKCIMISTHQVKDLENLIDRITILDQGKILFDESLDSISRKLHFGVTYDPQDIPGALYSEPALKGTTLVTANTNGEDSRPDLEMLYKAVMQQPQRLNAVFKN